MTWVLLLNSNDCKIFTFSKKQKALDLLQEMSHPENKGRNQDIVSDRPGHYSTTSLSGGAYQPRHDPKETKIDHFLLEISRLLEEGRLHQKYDDLLIIAPPKTYGHLMQHINKNVEKMITQHIAKDVVFLKQHELLNLLMNESQA